LALIDGFVINHSDPDDLDLVCPTLAGLAPGSERGWTIRVRRSQLWTWTLGFGLISLTSHVKELRPAFSEKPERAAAH